MVEPMQTTKQHDPQEDLAGQVIALSDVFPIDLAAQKG